MKFKHIILTLSIIKILSSCNDKKKAKQNTPKNTETHIEKTNKEAKAKEIDTKAEKALQKTQDSLKQVKEHGHYHGH